jgi:hypothetical protein
MIQVQESGIIISALGIVLSSFGSEFFFFFFFFVDKLKMSMFSGLVNSVKGFFSGETLEVESSGGGEEKESTSSSEEK